MAIIGILAAVGVNTFSGFQERAKNAVIKSNHQKVLETIKADIAQCYLEGGSNGKIDRYVRDGRAKFKLKKFECGRSAFGVGILQIYFLGLGLRDPVIVIPAAWYGSFKVPNDAGAVYAGVPFKEPKYYPAYWVGKTYITKDWSTGKRGLKIQAYLMDEKTLLLDYMELPF